MSHPLKRFTVNAANGVFRMIRQRIAQLPFSSDSDYFLALALHDCRFRRPQPNAFGERVLNQPPHKRDEALQQIVADYSADVRPMDEGDLEEGVKALFVDYFKNLPVRLEAAKRSVAPMRVNSRSPAKRKARRR